MQFGRCHRATAERGASKGCQNQAMSPRFTKEGRGSEKGSRRGFWAVKQKMVVQMDKVIHQYNINVLRFHDLSWYEEGHAQALAEAWDQAVKDKASNFEGKGLDEAALEEALLRDYEIEILYNW